MPKTLFYPAQIKNRLRRAPSMCQSLVQLAEVIPTSSGRSPYPPSTLTRGRLAHFVHLRTSGFSQCSHSSVSHSVVLHGFLSFFPTLALGSFPFFFKSIQPLRFSRESKSLLKSASVFKSIPSLSAKSFAMTIHFFDSEISVNLKLNKAWYFA